MTRLSVFSPLSFYIVLEVLTMTNQRRKRNKRNINWKRGKTVTVLNDILYTENPKDATRKLQELINEFGKVAGYKIHRNLAFLYTNNERSEGETKETIPFIITSKRKDYLGLNLPKDTKDLYSETIRH